MIDGPSPLAEFSTLIFQHRYALTLYVTLTLLILPIVDQVISRDSPLCDLRPNPDPDPPRLFDCFLYHSESYMLYLHLLTLSGYVDKFVIAYSNESFSTLAPSPISFSPFEPEILSFSGSIVFVHVDFGALPLSESRYRNATAWRREATARNRLLTGVESLSPAPRDLILLCDVDEIVTRDAALLVRRRPPVHYYNLRGLLFHGSFRWRVGSWERPLVIRYGAIAAPLDDYKFTRFVFPFPGVLHYHCSFCAPRIGDVLRKLASFSHTEYSRGRFRDPNYVWARLACGYGVLPPRWKMPERLTLVDFDGARIFVPDDPRLAFLKKRVGFEDIGEYAMNISKVKGYMPKECDLLDREQITIGVIE
jgi:hypothetical protein